MSVWLKHKNTLVDLKQRLYCIICKTEPKERVSEPEIEDQPNVEWGRGVGREGGHYRIGSKSFVNE